MKTNECTKQMNKLKVTATALMILLLASLASSAFAADTPTKAIEDYIYMWDKTNPESMIMGTQYDRRFGEAGESTREMIYELFSVDESEYTEDYELIQKPESFPYNSEQKYLTSGSYYDTVMSGLAELNIYPDRLFEMSYLYGLERGYSSLDAVAFSVNGNWYYYDMTDWHYIYLRLTNAPTLEVDQTIDYQRLIGTWNMVGVTNEYGEESSAYLDMQIDNLPFLKFQQDLTATDLINSNVQTQYSVQIDGGQLILNCLDSDTSVIMAVHFIDDNHLYLVLYHGPFDNTIVYHLEKQS